MVVVPSATAVAKPEALSMVAASVLLLVQTMPVSVVSIGVKVAEN